jgi:hypothetical protein
MWKSTRRGMLLVILIGLSLLLLTGLLWAANVAQAQLKATAVVYAWDQAANKFQNSNVVVAFDGGWVSFLHELNFDGTKYPDACGPGTSTEWAGVMEYGLYHEDNAPAGAAGFVESNAWQLVWCDRNGDGVFNKADLSVYPQNRKTQYNSDSFLVVTKDVTTTCTSGNCATEIVTTIFVNIDRDCDGVPNSDIPPGGLCFYAEAKTPKTGTPFWSGPLQARISAGGGDKTVNFKPLEVPTAVTLASFAATPVEGHVLVEWETASEIDNVGFNLYRSTDPNEGYIKLNETLIRSQSPGDILGAYYAYTDSAVEAGLTYYYKLEDIDVSGLRTMHGPVSATLSLSSAPVPTGNPPIYLPIVFGP